MWLNPIVEWNQLNKWADSLWSSEDPVPVNSYESDDSYLVQIPLAGVSIDDLEIDLKDNILKIKVEQQEKDWESFKALHRESSVHQFVQKLRLPKNTNADGVEAHVEEGVLLIRIPKSPDAETKKIEVK